MFTSNHVISVKSKLQTKLKDKKLEAKINDYLDDTPFQMLSSIAQVLEDIIPPCVSEKDLESFSVGTSDKVSRKDECEIQRAENAAETEALDDDANRLCPDIDTETNVADVEVDEDDVDETAENYIIYNKDLVDESVKKTQGKSKKGKTKKKKKSNKDDDKVVSQRLGYNRFMIESPWSKGNERLRDDSIRKTRVSAAERKERRRAIHRGVVEYSTHTTGATIRGLKRDKKAKTPPWVDHARVTFPDWFNQKK